MTTHRSSGATAHEVKLVLDHVSLYASLEIPTSAKGLVLFIHGSGSSRFSPRNTHVSQIFNRAGIATMLMDMLTESEAVIDEQTLEYRFDIDLLGDRVAAATDWIKQYDETRDLAVAYYGASTGAAAALVAAAQKPDVVKAVVSRGGRPDLADHALPNIKAPTLFIVGGNDVVILDLNKYAADLMEAEHKIEIVPGATHLFEEPGTLDQAAELAKNWYIEHFKT